MQTLFILNEATDNCWNLTEGMSFMDSQCSSQGLRIPGISGSTDEARKGPCECITESSTYDECSYLISGVATGIVIIGNIGIGLKFFVLEKKF